MVMKPWQVPPKRSLGIFEGLGEVLDKQEQRKATLEDRLNREDDRRRARGIQDLERQTLERRLEEYRKPPKVQRVKVTDETGRVHFVDPDNPPDDLYERRGDSESGTDATRMNTRIRELVAGGKSLGEANQQARSEFGFPPPRPRASSTTQGAAERREQAAAVRAGESKVGSMRREMKGVLGRRPRQSQFVDPLTRMADTTAFKEAMPNWRADSLDTAESLKAAQEELEAVKGGGASVPVPSPRAMGGGRAAGGNPQPQPRQAQTLEEAQAVDRAAWAAKNPPRPGESFEAYQQRYAAASRRRKP